MDEAVETEQLRVGDIFYHPEQVRRFIVTSLNYYGGTGCKELTIEEETYPYRVGNTGRIRTNPKNIPEWAKKYRVRAIKRNLVTKGLP